MTSNVDDSSTLPARSPRTSTHGISNSNNNTTTASSTSLAPASASANNASINNGHLDKRPSPKPGSAAAAASPARSRSRQSSPPPLKSVLPKKEDEAANESEAETEILSDGANDEKDAPAARRMKKPALKREDSEDEGAARKNGLVNGGSAINPKGERTRRKSNSTAVSTSPHASPPPHSIKSPSHNRGRSQSIAESRKRKARDEAPLKHSEPPRQRQRTEGSNGGTTGSRESPTLRHQPSSPAISAAASVKAHRRSASTQSVLQNPQPTRRKRDLANLILQPHKRDSWHSASSSDGDSSPRPHPSLQSHPQLKRASHRSLTSPARAMVHDKKRTDRFGATKLAREAERGDLDAVKVAFNENPDELDQPDFAGIAPLQKAALNGHVDVVEFLIESGCKTDCQSDNRDTPLIDAAENGHLDVIKVLLRKGKVNPHHQNKKGERAIDLIPSDDEDYEEMAKELKDAMLRESDTSYQKDVPPTSAKAEPSGLLYNEYNAETLKAKAAEGDMQLVGELLASNVKPNIHCGVAAARAGHHEILSLFLAEGLKPDPDPVKHPDTPMTVTIGRGHLPVIELLLSLENFDPTRKTKDGKTYYELAEERRGPKWEQERDMLKKAYDKHSSSKQRGSPKRERKPVHAATGGSASSASLQTKAKSIRKSSPRPSDRSSSPARAAAAEGKRQVGRKAAHPPELDPPAKSRRLLTGKEMSSQRDAAKRRRRVVSDDDESESEGDVPERKPLRKPHSTNKRAASDNEEMIKPVKKSAVKSRPDGQEKPRKLRASSPPAHSDDSGAETRKVSQKKTSTKPRSVDPPKNRAVQPTPETSSDAESHRKHPKKTSPKSGSSSKVKSEPAATDHSKAVGQPSPADTSKSAAQPSPRPLSEPSAPSPAPPPPPAVPSRTPTPVREERIAEAKRKEEERIAAEKAREEEERARQEAERLRREAAEKARLEAERLERVSKLPPALRRACEKGMDRPLCFDGDELGITYSFFPLHVFPLSEIDPTAYAALPIEDPARSREYVLSFQVVGVLGLPELDIAKSYPDWERKQVTETQWELFLQQYDVARMAQDFRFPMEGTKYWNDVEIQHKLWDAREKMKGMGPLFWVPFELFEKEIRLGGKPLEEEQIQQEQVEESTVEKKEEPKEETKEESKLAPADIDNKESSATAPQPEFKKPDAPTDTSPEKMDIDSAPTTGSNDAPPNAGTEAKQQDPESDGPPEEEGLDRARKVRDMLRSTPLQIKRYIKVRKEPITTTNGLTNGDGVMRKKSFIDLVMNRS